MGIRQRDIISALLLGLLIACFGTAGPAWAQSGSDDQGAAWESGGDRAMGDDSLDVGGDGERPWAEGVSIENQERARTLFKEGNELIQESRISEAVTKYREALEYWDHPGIHYNLSFALIDQKQTIDAYESLKRAISYGPDPIGAQRVARAEENIRILSQQLGEIEITCTEPDARVTLNGENVLTCPGTYRRIATVGEYQVAASKPKYLPETYDVVLSAEETERVEVVLYTVADMTVTKRRWQPWMPWAVVGAGTAVLVLGGGLHTSARGGFSSFDTDFDTLCGDGGCLDNEIPQLTDRLDSATNKQRIAYVSYAIGGAALAGGLVLVYLNRPRVFRRDNLEQEISLVPVLAPDSMGVSAALRF